MGTVGIGGRELAVGRLQPREAFDVELGIAERRGSRELVGPGVRTSVDLEDYS